MVNRDNNGAFSRLAIRLQTLELALQESQLRISYDRELSALRRDNSRARIQHVAVEADDRNVRSIQGEINSRLRHHRSYQASRIRGRPGSVSAEISQERLQRCNLRSR